jgi:hypothetical protein
MVVVRSRRQTIKRIALVWLGLYVACAVLIAALQEWNQSAYARIMDDLVAHRTHGVATVTAITPHNGVCYRYLVNATSYNACSQADYSGEPSSALSVGGTIDIYFDPTNPSTSCSCDPVTESAGLSKGPLALGATGGALVALVLTGLLWNWLLQPRPVDAAPADPSVQHRT